jgi:hypothetical protein
MPSSRNKTVFISGSAYEYGSFGDHGKDFIRRLTGSLLQNNFGIISGFGHGVGNYVVEGALHEIYREPQARLSDQLRVYPFPVLNGYTPPGGLDHLRQAYRNDMISQAGTAIFLFGNKLEDIAVREADGMRKEFEIAKTYGALLIPVGASGYMSAALWQELAGNYDDYFSDRSTYPWFERLGDPATGPDELIDAILRITTTIHG